MKLRFLPLLAAAASLAQAATPALVWSDEFNQAEGAAPDSTRWTYNLGAGGWGNNELETYTDSRDNSFIAADPAATDGKVLVIRAIKTATGYTSARLLTQGRTSVQFGRVEARLKSTNGQGLWPAFWMLGDRIATTSWPACGEIDIMEIVGAAPNRAYGTLHGPGYSGSTGIGNNHALSAGATYDQAYHIFAIDWSPGEIVWSVDGTVYHRVTSTQIPAGSSWVFDAPFFLLLNLAVGGNWPGNPDASTVFPQDYRIDYVRVYALAPAAPPAVGGFASTRTSATLTWRPATNADGSAVTGYRVERATDAAFTQGLTSFTLGAVTSFVDTTATSNTTYYYRVVTLSAGGASDPSATVTVSTAIPSSSEASHLLNISARARCGVDDNVTIGGFVIGGGTPKRILVRAVGPTLAYSGLKPADLLTNPKLELYRDGTLVAVNDDWETNANLDDLRTTGSRIGAMPLDSADHTSAALLVTLPPGVYSFVVTGSNGSTGIVLLETYDAD